MPRKYLQSIRGGNRRYLRRHCESSQHHRCAAQVLEPGLFHCLNTRYVALIYVQIINAGCYNLKKMNGTQICISSPGTPYVSPKIPSALAPSIASTAAPVPTDAVDGTNKYCGKWYHAVAGDYCNLLTLKFHLSLQDFVFLNPTINVNCTNLYADESYCVQAVGDSQ